jgi:hypothetical protein
MRISRITLVAGTLLSLVVGAASPCSAASITYDVNQTIGAGGVTGDIVTDGKIGTLGLSDIVDWNLLLNDGTNTTDLLGPLSGSNSTVIVLPSPNPNLSATATQLLFNFSGSPTGNPTAGELIFESTAIPIDGYLCFNSVGCTQALPFPPPGTGVEQLSATSIGGGFGNFQGTELTGTQAIGTATAVPAPLIGHGLPVVLAVGGLLFGAKLWERSKSRRSFGTAIPRAAAMN